MVILPDASAYSRPELGGLLFGLRERQPRDSLPPLAVQEPALLQPAASVEVSRLWLRVIPAPST